MSMHGRGSKGRTIGFTRATPAAPSGEGSQRSPSRPASFTSDPTAAEVPRIRVLRIRNQKPEKTHRVTYAHSHQFLELVYLERPAGWHRLGREEWTTQEGDLLLIAPGEVHQWDPRILHLDTDGWIVHFELDALTPTQSGGSLLSQIGNPLLVPFLRSTRGERGRLNVPSADRPTWSNRLDRLHQELATQREGFQEAAKALLALLLVDATRLVAATDRHFVQTQPLMYDVLRFVEEHYARPISLADVAKAVHRSSAYLTNMIQRSTGRTVLQWIIERRMAEARRLLTETDLPVARIAEQVSYTDPTYFIRQFRRTHRTTPASWRRSVR